MAKLIVRIYFPLQLESASLAEFAIDSNGAEFTRIAKVMHPHQNLVCTIPPIKQNV